MTITYCVLRVNVGDKKLADTRDRCRGVMPSLEGLDLAEVSVCLCETGRPYEGRPEACPLLASLSRKADRLATQPAVQLAYAQ